MKRFSFFLTLVVALITIVAFVTFPFKEVKSSNFEYLQRGWTGVPTSNQNPLPAHEFTNWEIPSGYTAVLECLIWRGRKEGNLIAFKGPQRISGKLEIGWWAIVPNDQGSRLFTERYNNLIRNNGARRWLFPLPEWNWSPSDPSEEWLYSSIPMGGFATGWCEGLLNGHWTDLKQSCNNPLVVHNRSGERIQVRYKRSNPNDPRDRSLVTIYGPGNSLESIKTAYANQMGVPINHLSVRYLPN